jgi:hypothetical protein
VSKRDMGIHVNETNQYMYRATEQSTMLILPVRLELHP